MGLGQALLNRVPFGKFNRAGGEGLLRSGDHLLGLARLQLRGRQGLGLCPALAGSRKESPIPYDQILGDR